MSQKRKYATNAARQAAYRKRRRRRLLTRGSASVKYPTWAIRFLLSLFPDHLAAAVQQTGALYGDGSARSSELRRAWEKVQEAGYVTRTP